VARAVVELYEPAAEEKGLSLRLDSEAATMIRGDRHLMSQAIANLLDNAIKYGASEVAISVHERDGRALLDIADRGPGIPEADRETVFDRFVRLEPSRSTPGNGLGLSLVRAVAHRHGARVTLSDNRPGLRVRIDLPACA
jgi:signal transduction histidine kinase